MTRLKSADIAPITQSLMELDRDLIKKTGLTLRGVACAAAHVDESRIAETIGSLRACVVPITAGMGVIPGFSETVATILSHIGFSSSITRASDAGGVAEAFGRKADLLLMADDHSFTALNLITRTGVDNAEATARGFAAGLERMAGGLEKKPVLVLGCGPVGRAAAKALMLQKAAVTLFDLIEERARALARDLGRPKGTEIRVETNLEAALARYDCLYDATPSGGFIKARHITEKTLAAGPGVPMGLDAKALSLMGERFLHDPLETGVATMAVLAAYGAVSSRQDEQHLERT